MIEINNLTKDYGDEKGIFNLSFDVKQGEVFGFLGPNGAGKTTTIRHLMGFIHSDGGSCSINNLDCGTCSAEIQKNLGYVPGEIAFFDNMTGTQFIHFIASYRGVKDWNRVESLIKRFELDTKGKLKKMSRGMKQKMGIVCGFIHDPDVLILDEPTSGLDPLMQNVFVELILEEKAKGKTILMSSHIFEEVEKTADRVGIIKKGRLVAVDSVSNLKSSRRKKYIITLENEIAAADFASEFFDDKSQSNNVVTVTIKQNIKKFIEVLNRYPVTNIDVAEQSLEDVFLHYYGGNSND
ncbi:MAG: ABC transporter ATP-binding protein [Bacteroidales bacterium]|jgi:ABC-2 type transport system ATP-binding protein